MRESLNSFLARLNEAVAPHTAKVVVYTENNSYRQYHKIEVKLSAESAVIGYYYVAHAPDILAIAAFCAKAEGEGRSNTLYILEGSDIPEKAYSFSMFENIVIPEGIDVIREKVFMGCKNLKSISIPESVEEIEADAFRKCKSLEEVTFHNKSVKIKNGAFFECPQITKVNLPQGLTWKSVKDYFKDSPRGMHAPKPAAAKKAKTEKEKEKVKEKESAPKKVAPKEKQEFSADSLEEKAKSILSGYTSNVKYDGNNLSIKTFLRNGNFVGGLFRINKRKGIEQVDWNSLSEALKQAGACEQRGTLFAIGNVVVECKDIADEKRVKHLVDPNGVVINGDKPEKFAEGITKIFDEQAAVEFVIERTGYKVSLTAVNVADKFVQHDIVIPDGVTEIGEEVFKAVPSIVSVYIPDSVTKICDCAFYECRLLKTVRLSNSLSYIGGCAFCHCESLEEITLPHRLSVVYHRAFNDCHSLRTITILSPEIDFIKLVVRGKRGKAIYYVFEDCKAIKEVYLPKGLVWSTRIKEHFKDTELVRPISLGDVNRKPSVAGNPLQEMALADAVKDLFYPLVPYVECVDDKMVMFVRLPNGNAILGLDKVKDADTAAAEVDWELVKELTNKAEDNPESGTLYIFGGTLVKTYSELRFLWKNKKYDRSKKEYIDYSDFHIVVFAKGHYVFNDFFKRREISLSNSVNLFLSKIIFDPYAILEGVWKFDIPTLKEIILPKTLTALPDKVFNGCSLLAGIDIPEGVARIGLQAFSGCKSLKSVVIPENITEIAPDAFGFCKSLESMTFQCKIADIKNETFEGCEALKEIVLPDGLKKIDRAAFRDCAKLEKVIIPDGVAEIGEETFSGCKALKDPAFPESLTRIGGKAFANCIAIVSLHLPRALDRLDSYVFQDCKRLESVTIENPDIKWQTEPFNGCDHISEVNLPQGFPIRSENRIFKGSSWKAAQ